MITEVNARNFVLQNINTSTLNLGKANYIFLLIKADWCVFCKKYQQPFEEYSTQFPNAHFLVLEVTTPENKNLIEQWAGLAYPPVPTPAGSMDEPSPEKRAVFNPEKKLRYPTVVLYSGSGVPIAIVNDRNDLAGAVADAQAKAAAAQRNAA